MDPNQPKSNELPAICLGPSMLVELNKSINSELERLKNPSSIEERKKSASDLWLNLLHKEANLKALDFSHKIKFIQQQPPGFLRNCHRIWGSMVNSAREKATMALANISHNLGVIEEIGGGEADDTFDAFNDKIDEVSDLSREIYKILDNFKPMKVFAEASRNLSGRRVDTTQDHNYKRQKVLKMEEPPVSGDSSYSSNELLEKVKNSINIDEQMKLASDLWLDLLNMEATVSKNNDLEIDIPDQQNFSKKCEDICSKLVELAKRKVSALLSNVEGCHADIEEESYYRDEITVDLQAASRKFSKLIKFLEDLDMNKVFTEALCNP